MWRDVLRLIAGEALMGIGLAAFVPLKLFPMVEEGHAVISLALFAAILFVYSRFARPKSGSLS